MNELIVLVRGSSAFGSGCLASLVMVCAHPMALGQEAGGEFREVPAIPLTSPGSADGKSLSTSKQFVIYGRTLALRGAFSVFAERVKADYLDLIYASGRDTRHGARPEKDDRWVYQIVLQVRDKAPGFGENAVTTRIRQLEQGGFRLEVNASVGDGFESEVLRRELLRVLLAESIQRDHTAIQVVGREELLPKWLLAGVAETLGHKSRGRSSKLYEKVFQTGRILTVEEILSTDPERLDSVSRTIFELSSAGLLRTLLDQPAGGSLLRAFISGLATYNGSQRDLLLSHFPGMRTSTNSLEKWWALQMASMSQPGVFDLMTPEETELTLAEALLIQFEEPKAGAAGAVEQAGSSKKPSGIVRVGNRVFGLFRPKGGGNADLTQPERQEESRPPAPESGGQAKGDEESATVTCGAEEVELYFGHPDRAAILKPVQLKLAHLSQRAHPLYRKLLHDYQELTGRIAEGNRDGAEAQFANLAGRRTLIQRQAGAIADRLNWFEATQTETPSGKFERFHETVDAIENARRPGGRKDPISRYLDALEHEFK